MLAFDHAPPPDRLWHYTSGAGAKGIFQSRTLWAGHLGYMNDTSEVNHAMNLSKEVVERLKDQLPEHQEAFTRWLKYVTDSPPRSWAPNTFTVSFSEQRDLLSQWRGYATGPGGPFSIGFPSSMLMRDSPTSEGYIWQLGKCIYSRDAQLELIERKIRFGLGVTASAAKNPGPYTKPFGEAGFGQIYGQVMALAPLCKHPDFAEEREWRLVFGPTDVRKVSPVHFVERRHHLAPYIEFRLTDEDGEVLDDVIWYAGPGPHQERANLALGMVARAEGMTGYTGYNSATPYLP